MSRAQGLAFVEGLKELLRVILIAIIPVLIDSLQKGSVDWRTVTVVAALAGLRGIEKALYEYKPTNNNPVTEFLKFE
jgi:hypothetical protein